VGRWLGHKEGRAPAGAELLFGEARRLIATMSHCLRHLRPRTEARSALRPPDIAAALLCGMDVAPAPEAIAVINAALILCTDHELAQSTFVARIAASAGADLGECIGEAILTQTGMTAAGAHDRDE